jgi:hypothetical protein
MHRPAKPEPTIATRVSTGVLAALPAALPAGVVAVLAVAVAICAASKKVVYGPARAPAINYVSLPM